ncbi:hypothetical protein TL16_g04176 [Triparma laevis f. inornata]|uniref:Uncharacterized protein n=1 Tax=Triparma laevis f. inornata TaxID=1714386 RepID=A0A9W7A9Y6_9STRA|nr:hypothetical protein TL16_g04176 [Triparma laevis f. inornata]
MRESEAREKANDAALKAHVAETEAVWEKFSSVIHDLNLEVENAQKEQKAQAEAARKFSSVINALKQEKEALKDKLKKPGAANAGTFADSSLAVNGKQNKDTSLNLPLCLKVERDANGEIRIDVASIEKDLDTTCLPVPPSATAKASQLLLNGGSIILKPLSLGRTSFTLTAQADLREVGQFDDVDGSPSHGAGLIENLKTEFASPDRKIRASADSKTMRSIKSTSSRVSAGSGTAKRGDSIKAGELLGEMVGQFYKRFEKEPVIDERRKKHICDLITDLVVLRQYWEGGEKMLKYRNASLASLTTSIVLQLMVMAMQNRKKGVRRILKKMAYVITGLKAPLDAYRVANGAEQEKDTELDPMTEMTYGKCMGMFAESIPGIVIQTSAIINDLNSGETVSMTAYLSLAVSILTTGFVSATLSYDWDTDPKKRAAMPNYYGYVPDSPRVTQFRHPNEVGGLYFTLNLFTPALDLALVLNLMVKDTFNELTTKLLLLVWGRVTVLSSGKRRSLSGSRMTGRRLYQGYIPMKKREGDEEATEMREEKKDAVVTDEEKQGGHRKSLIDTFINQKKNNKVAPEGVMKGNDI